MSEENRTIEDQIRSGLSGDVQKNALGFAAFLRANDFSLEWNEQHELWSIFCKDKNIVGSKVIGDENVFAIVFNTCDFGDGPADDDVKEFTWAHMVNCPNGCCGPKICEMSVKHRTVFGKEYSNTCVAPMECFNLGADELLKAQTLMLMLKAKQR